MPPLAVGHRMSFEALHVADSTMYFYSVHEHVENSTSLKETVYKPANSLLLLYYLLHACKVLRFNKQKIIIMVDLGLKIIILSLNSESAITCPLSTPLLNYAHTVTW